MIRVVVTGCNGKMGSEVVCAVGSADDMEIAAGVDTSAVPQSVSDAGFPYFTDLKDALDAVDADVVVDFTHPSAVSRNIETALTHGVNCVVGTTGLSKEELESLSEKAIGGACLFYAPNFTTGAVLMMAFAKIAAKYFPESEVIEYHHCNKADSPSGTAINTAKIIAEGRDCESNAPGKETELEGCEGARGALVEGVPVHSVRSMGFVANQDVIFGSMGQSLKISHTSWDRKSYMPGVLLAIRNVGNMSGLVIGLDKLMGLNV